MNPWCLPQVAEGHVVGVRCSHVALGVPVYPSYSFFRIVSVAGDQRSVDMRLLGVGKQARRPAELSEALSAWNWIGFCKCLGGFLLFSPRVDVFRQPCVPGQAGNARADRAHLAHPSAQKSRHWGQHQTRRP